MGMGTKIHSQGRHAVRRAAGPSCGPPVGLLWAILWTSYGSPVGHPVGREIESRANTVTKTLSGWPTLKVTCLCIPWLGFT